MAVSLRPSQGRAAGLSGACDVSMLRCRLLSVVSSSSCPIPFASSTKVAAPLHQGSLGPCRQLTDCHLSAARTGQEAGSPLAAGHVTQLSVLTALQTSPIAVLLSI